MRNISLFNNTIQRRISDIELKTTTKGKDVMEMISSFFESNGLQWKNVGGVCTDGAPAMLGSRLGFQMKVRELVPQEKGMHCNIHRFALATKTLPKPLQEVLDSLLAIVNYIKSSALNTCLFKELCNNMNSDHEVLLFYTAVRWLSKGNVVGRFLEMEEKLLENGRVAYLSGILDQLNELNLKLQDNIQAFILKLQNCRLKVNRRNLAMFEHLSTETEQSETGIVDNLREEINNHLRALDSEIQRYFPEFSEQEAVLVRNPFHVSLDVSDIPDEVQDEFLELRNDSSA
ncbi:hypothetical protein J437_LFUL014497, partial [Ladona fulva]